MIKKPSVPLTVSPLNPAAQGGDHHAASGFPVMPDMHNSDVRWSPGGALSARGLTVWRIRQAQSEYNGLWSVDLQLSQLVESFIKLAVEGFDATLLLVGSTCRLAIA